MIYIDTSSLLKTVILDNLSGVVIGAIRSETQVVLTPLAHLEALVRLRASYLGGNLSKNRWQQMVRKFEHSIEAKPYVQIQTEMTVYQIAIRQQSESTVHCRSLDRLHLAAMEELGVGRLMTHDVRQAEAAREMGYEVVMPGIEA